VLLIIIINVPSTFHPSYNNIFSDEVFTGVRVGQPVTHMRSHKTIPNEQNQAHPPFLFKKPFHSNIHHNRKGYHVEMNSKAICGKFFMNPFHCN